MKMGDLRMHCDNCDIIDYCNVYEDTPPCDQPRFENLDTKDFIRLAESSSCGDKNDIFDDFARRMEGETDE